VFRALGSATFLERLASSPSTHIVTQWTLERPDRVEYRIRGDADGIVIGTDRWDSTDGVHWRSPRRRSFRSQHRLEQHRDERASSREGRDTLRVSFFNPTTPAWFELWLDGRKLRPVKLEMTATARFMHQRYTAFDFPRRIFPPR
jgi:hypothetical protein